VEPTGEIIEGEYIVVLHDDATSETLSAHIRELLATGFQVEILFEYHNLPGFKGFSARLDENALNYELQHREVDFVEKSQIMLASAGACSDQKDATWGLDRINERNLDLDGNYRYSYTGSGVTAYIVDTGIYTQNEDFGGRAVWGENFSGDGQNTDCNGHGTHVASTVGGTTYGVAKGVKLVAVKVLGCAGNGTNAGVIAGVDYVAQQGGKKSKVDVANMSLGGGFSSALNKAVESAVKAGVVFVVAAGNEDQDACNVSPASEKAAITVAATATTSEEGEQVDIRSSFSNYGTCVTVAAPGTEITAAWIGDTSAIRTISGTSMASPHVCGVAALLSEENPDYKPDDIKNAIVDRGTQDKIDLNCGLKGWFNDCDETPNSLVFTGCKA
jgi:subtilisin family serine protease